jgi:hypothetical protein
MIDFNSFLLKPLPPPAKPDRTAAKMTKRLVIAAVLAAVIGIPAFVIVTRILPVDGAGYVFYWLHDHVYLPIKGNSFTQFYPYSISWWGMAATVGFFWLLGYLTRTSVLKEAHIFWLRKILRRSNRHRFLIKSSHLLEKIKLKPLLLHQTTALERKLALLRLTSMPINKTAGDNEKLIEKRAAQLTHLTILNLNLQLRPHHPKSLKMKTGDPKEPGKEAHPDLSDNITPNLEAARYWHQAYLHIRAHLDRRPGNKKLQQLAALLANQIELILSPILDLTDPEQLREAEEKTGRFDLRAAALDLYYLASLHNRDIADALHHPTGGESLPGPSETQQTATQHLAVSVSRHQSALETVIRQLENNVVDLDHLFPPDQEVHHHLAAISRWILSTALDFSMLSANPSVAAAYMETHEILAFTLDCLDPESPIMDELYPVHQLLQLPEPQHYRLCAALMETGINNYEQVWQHSILKESEIILPSDFQLSRAQIRHLTHAAGPSRKDTPKE